MKRIPFYLFIGLLAMSACTAQPTAEPQPAVPPTEAVSPAQPTAEPAQPTAEPAGIRITDSLGRQVDLPAAPQRIAATGKAFIMVVDAIYMFPEAPERMTALGNFGQGGSNFIAMIDPDYAAKATLQQDAGAEQIAATRPDLVILKSTLAETVGPSLDTLKIPVVFVDFENPEQYERDLAILGEVFQNQERASQVIAYYQGKVAGVQAAVKDVEEKPSVLMLYYSDKDGVVAFNVPPLSWIQTQLVQLAGGEPAWADANPAKGWTKVTLEQIAAWDADQVFIISYTRNPSEVKAELEADPQWQQLRAAREGHLYAFPADLYSWDQPDARWVLGLNWLAGRLHPQRFAGLDIKSEAAEFYATLYGLDGEFFEQKIVPTFKGDLP